MRAVVMVLATALLGCAARPAMAPEPATAISLAARANEQGEAALAEGRYAEAGERFFEAVARNPEPLYLLNLCRARYAEGDLVDARLACAQASAQSPNPVFDAAVIRLQAKLGTPEPVAAAEPAKPAEPPKPEPPPVFTVEPPAPEPRVILYCPEPEVEPVRRPKRTAKVGRLDCTRTILDARNRACVRAYCEANELDIRCSLE